VSSPCRAAGSARHGQQAACGAVDTASRRLQLGSAAIQSDANLSLFCVYPRVPLLKKIKGVPGGSRARSRAAPARPAPPAPPTGRPPPARAPLISTPLLGSRAPCYPTLLCGSGRVPCLWPPPARPPLSYCHLIISMPSLGSRARCHPMLLCGSGGAPCLRQGLPGATCSSRGAHTATPGLPGTWELCSSVSFQQLLGGVHHPVTPRAGPVGCAGWGRRLGRAEPLVAVARVEVGAEAGHVQRDRAQRVRAVHQHCRPRATGSFTCSNREAPDGSGACNALVMPHCRGPCRWSNVRRVSLARLAGAH